MIGESRIAAVQGEHECQACRAVRDEHCLAGKPSERVHVAQRAVAGVDVEGESERGHDPRQCRRHERAGEPVGNPMTVGGRGEADLRERKQTATHAIIGAYTEDRLSKRGRCADSPRRT